MMLEVSALPPFETYFYILHLEFDILRLESRLLTSDTAIRLH